ncbi:MAG TPA: Smr/MutS family protein [Xanthobacteraceae bacterium]|nr:Smr/MutS family protein [Xanthobacteraceae bacterium]
MSRRRRLTDDEEALWTGITRSVKPLRPAKTKAKAADPARTMAPKALPQRATKSHQVAVPPSPKRPPPLAPLDRREKKRVARGRDAIEARIDLHGMTQSEAHAALMGFIRRAQSNGARLVLVVTGKGSGTSRHGEGGVLRRQVPLWLALPELRSFILGFDAAHVAHGGEGALYVRLRRNR